MWTPFSSKDSDDYDRKESLQLSDVLEENKTLRKELSSLYSQLAHQSDEEISDISNNNKTSGSNKRFRHSWANNQSIQSLFITESEKEKKIIELQNELSFQRSHIKELAIKNKELKEVCHSKEEELLKLNINIVQTVPLKMKLKEQKKEIDELNYHIGNIRQAKMNIEIELLETEKFTTSLTSELTCIKDINSDLRIQNEKISWELKDLESKLSSVRHEKESLSHEIDDCKTRQLKDDLKVSILKSEISSWEQKCRTLEREIENLLQNCDNEEEEEEKITSSPIHKKSVDLGTTDSLLKTMGYHRDDNEEMTDCSCFFFQRKL